MGDNLKYGCSDCGFTWITLNGKHNACPKCHSEKIEFLGEVDGLDVDAILNYNKMRGGCCGSAHGKGPLTCGKPYPDHHDSNSIHNTEKCCGHKAY